MSCAHRNHLSGHIAHTTLPLLRRLIQHIVDPDLLVLLDQRIQIILEQDVLRGDVGKDEVHPRHVAIVPATDDGPHDLKHGRDACTASNHAKVLHHVGIVNESALRSAHSDGLSDDERGHVLGDVALRVGLDEEVEVPGLVIARDGSVRADNLLGGAVWLGQGRTNGDVLADGEAEDGVARGQLEAVAAQKSVSPRP